MSIIVQAYAFLWDLGFNFFIRNYVCNHSFKSSFPVAYCTVALQMRRSFSCVCVFFILNKRFITLRVCMSIEIAKL